MAERTCHVMIAQRSCDEDNFLPMLSYVLKHGNVTVYEWKHGNGPPETTTSMSAGSQSAAVIAESADIDWGDEIGKLWDCNLLFIFIFLL